MKIMTSSGVSKLRPRGANCGLGFIFNWPSPSYIFLLVALSEKKFGHPWTRWSSLHDVYKPYLNTAACSGRVLAVHTVCADRGTSGMVRVGSVLTPHAAFSSSHRHMEETCYRTLPSLLLCFSSRVLWRVGGGKVLNTGRGAWVHYWTSE